LGQARLALKALALRQCASGEEPVIFSAELLVQTLLSGLMVGVLYALMALGITFIYSIVKTINWAMGEFYMIGSYIQFVGVHFLLGPNLWWLAAILAAGGTFVLGLILEPILIKPMYARPLQRRDDYATVVTIALLLLLRNLAVALGGPNQYRPESNLPVVWIGPLPQEGARVAASIFAVLALGVFWLVIKKTWVGLALRAAAQNRVAVQTAGVDVFRLDAIAFAIGVALAGFAGALLAPLFMVFPTNGAVTTVKGFEIIVIGGLGSIPGALIGGLLLGLVESLGAAFISSPYQNVYGFLLVILVLILKPNGLFGERGREA
jgi:branched-chain amino acid transport system permease protein